MRKRWERLPDVLVNDFGEIEVFELLDAAGQGFGRIGFPDGAAGLKKGFAMVVFFIDQVDGDAGFLFACGEHGFVNAVAIHALASEFGQKSRVDIDHPVFKCVDEVSGNEPEKTGKNDEVYGAVFQFGERVAGVVERFPFEQKRRYPLVRGKLKYRGILSVGCDQRDPRFWRDFEVLSDLSGVGAGSGCENGDSSHDGAIIKGIENCDWNITFLANISSHTKKCSKDGRYGPALSTKLEPNEGRRANILKE